MCESADQISQNFEGDHLFLNKRSSMTMEPSWFSHSSVGMSPPIARCESKRLAPDEANWQLQRGDVVLTQTRGGGNGCPDFERAIKRRTEFQIEPRVANPLLNYDDSDNGASVEAPTPTSKPSHTRVILKVSQLEQAFRNVPCPECGGVLELKLQTVCIATHIQLTCNNNNCSYVSNNNKPCTTTMHEDDHGNYERMTDYAINVLMFLVLFQWATHTQRLVDFSVFLVCRMTPP